MRTEWYKLDENYNLVNLNSLEEWIEQTKKLAEKRIIGRNHVFVNDERIFVSTVFLGIDHSFSNHGEPILFETMVFGGINDQYQNRYCTFREACNGHLQVLEQIKNNNKIED